MADDEIMISFSRAQDPDGSRLRQTFEVQLAIDWARSLRDLMTRLMAAASVPLAVMATWLRAPPVLRKTALTAWVMSLAGVVVAGLAERKYLHRRAQLIGAIGPIDRTAR